MNAALQALGDLRQVYLHVDIDVLDQTVAPGVNFPTSGGRSVPQLQAIVRQVFGLGTIAAMSLTAVNPEKDVGGRTVQAALDVIAAAVGSISED